VVRKRCPKAAVVGIDLLPTEPIEGVTIFQMDFMADEAPAALTEALDGPPDLVLSDMAANTVGHKQTDHLRTMGLVETAADFAIARWRRAAPSVAKVLARGHRYRSRCWPC
jgi:23S rRNA (uridine2552-2'-O)-methyltransferase